MASELHPDVERAIRIETRGRKRVIRKAAYATTIVEAGGQNPRRGHLDSLGSFQQRPSQGWGTPEQVMNPRYAARKFVQAAERIVRQNPNITSAELAQAVQRSAYPERYGARDVQAQAQRLSRPGGAGGPSDVTLQGPRTTDVSLGTKIIPGQSFEEERRAERRKLFLSAGGLTMDKLLDYKQSIKSLQDVPEQVVRGDLKVKRSQGAPIRVRGRDQDTVAPNAKGNIYEVFYDPMGEYWDSGGLHKGAIGGHGKHIHVSGDKAYVERLGRFAQEMGLEVGEQSAFGGTPTGGHTEGSFHYKDMAIDVSGGTPAKRRKFARIVLREARRGRGR